MHEGLSLEIKFSEFTRIENFAQNKSTLFKVYT